MAYSQQYGLFDFRNHARDGPKVDSSGIAVCISLRAFYGKFDSEDASQHHEGKAHDGLAGISCRTEEDLLIKL